ncbi:unnamed protein product [Arabidopsis thaliana]|uniref:RNase H type-1 domain-containing protein n=1 Tax=Arabidopsis thaliana TaxID=3702 RepID=A0A5S9XHI6_ARATH|nr:unnamed protein product [Arabidopsis thaliana]
MSSVAFLDLRPPPAPPPESSSPLTPQEPPDPPDPQICLSFNVSLTQSPSTTRNPLLPAKPRNSFGVLLLDESLFANWFGEMFPQFNRPAARNLLVFENRSITEANTLSKALYVAKLTCQAPKRGIPTTIEAAPLSLPCIETQHQRVIHQGSSSRLHTPSALAAEALAIKSAKSALTAALRMEFTSITVCSDSQVLTSLLNTETTSNELQGILHDITCLCRSLLSFKFCFISRLANVSADATAKEALFSLDFPVV